MNIYLVISLFIVITFAIVMSYFQWRDSCRCTIYRAIIRDIIRRYPELNEPIQYAMKRWGEENNIRITLDDK